MPGVFKRFFDVVVGMARAVHVLTLPMAVYVDDCALIGAIRAVAGGQDATGVHDATSWCGEHAHGFVRFDGGSTFAMASSKGFTSGQVRYEVDALFMGLNMGKGWLRPLPGGVGDEVLRN
jgi:hypothetical protein